MTPTVEAVAPPPPRISVIIVSHNRAELLRQSLETLGTEHQLIVVDNGSSDGAAALHQDFPKVQFIRLPKNFGLTKALNLGLRAAEGEYLLFLHDDARIAGEAVSRLADVLAGTPEVGAVAPLFPGKPQAAELPSVSHPYPEWHTVEGDADVDVDCVSGAAIMLRQQFMRAMRHIDERYGNYGSNLDLCAQVRRRASKKVRIVCNVTALHDVLGTDDSLLSADRAIGTAVFLGKYYGVGAGLKFRAASALSAIFSFRLGMAKHLLSNQKLDGTQS